MKFCPVCKTRYDEEILRFCTKDGAPLVEESTPNFTGFPSAPADDPGEETIIRRKPKAQQTVPAPLPEDFEDEPSYQNPRNSAERIVIPTAEQQQREQQVRSKAAAYQQPPPSNTAKVVVMTIVGTIIVLAGAGGLIWFLRSQTPTANSNLNVNMNPYNIGTNLNTNLNIDNSFNFNAATNINSNVNSNFNANLNANTNLNVNVNKSPTPKPSISPTPKPSESPGESNVNSAPNVTVSPTPRATVSPTPGPAPTPRVSPPAPPANRPVNAGLLNGQAINLPKPAYPAPARAMKANGQVTVQITLDESGNVMSAKAVSGNPLLRQSAENAARQSRFNPIRVSGQAVSATGILVYNFVN